MTRKEIWAFAECERGEIRRDSLETVGEAVHVGKALKMPAVAVLVGCDVEKAVDAVVKQGASVVRVVDDVRLERFDAAFYGACFEAATEGDWPLATFAALSPNGLSLVPWLAARAQCAFVPDVVSFSAGEKTGYTVVREVYDGKAHVRCALAANKPVVLGLKPGSVGVGPEVKKPAGEVVRMDAPADLAPATKVVGFEKANPATVALDEADMVVAGGLGYSSKDDLHILQELSEALDAALGGSKPVFDNGWIPRERFIGQSSGRKLSPRLLVATGISGSSYFMGGIKGTQNIVAINRDKGAPIMKAADLAVVGDLHEIVPAMTKALANRRKEVDA